MAFDWRILVFGGLVALVGGITIYQTASAPPPPAPSPSASVALGGASASTKVEKAVVNTAVSDAPKAEPTKARMFIATLPAGKVETYVEGDFQGERLEGANWAAKYKKLVNWSTEPNWDQAYIIRSYNVESGKVGKDQAEAVVTYDTMGELDLDLLTYTPSPTRQSVTFTLKKENDEWLIAFPTLRPHPSLEAAIAHLERMAVGYPLKRPAIEELLTQLRSEQAQEKSRKK